MTNSTKQQNKNGRGKDKNGRSMHPNSLKNLQGGRWKKGESGNPKGQSITQRQQQMMPEVCPFDKQGRIWLDSLAEAGMRMALVQSFAMSNLLDRHEGKVTQPIGGEGGGEITIKVVYDNNDKT